MLGWAGTDTTKKRHRVMLRTLVFLHSVGSAGYVVHSSASGEQNVMMWTSALVIHPHLLKIRFLERLLGLVHSN
jgi:hypothetical protein